MVLAVLAYLVTHRSVPTSGGYVPVKTSELSLPNGAKFTDQQFDTYKAVWLALNRLRKAGDALWHNANKANLTAYASSLRETVELVDANGIFFHPRDYSQLRELLRTFANYRIGKKRLIEMRRVRRRVSEHYIEDIKAQIESNQASMLEYSALLDRIRETYHDRLSWTKTA